MEPPSLEVGASSFLLNTVYFKGPEESALEKNRKCGCVYQRKKRGILNTLESRSLNSAEPGPASEKTTQIPPWEQAPQHKQTRQ